MTSLDAAVALEAAVKSFVGCFTGFPLDKPGKCGSKSEPEIEAV